jgi:hypothetical protein
MFCFEKQSLRKTAAPVKTDLKSRERNASPGISALLADLFPNGDGRLRISVRVVADDDDVAVEWRPGF